MPTVALTGGKVVIKAGKVACTCCCPTTLPGIRAEQVTATVRGYGFIPYDQLNDTGIYNGVPLDDILTLYSQRVESFTADFGYSGFLFTNINPIADSPCAGCCVRLDIDNSWTAAATITTDFGGIGGTYSQTRSPDFSSPAGTFSNSQTSTGQNGCSEACADVVTDSGDTDIIYYTFTPGDVTGPTTRSGSSSIETGGQSGGADCEGETVKVLPGTLDLAGDGTLSNGFTRDDVVAAGVAALPTWPGTWSGSAASTRSVGMGVYGLFVAGAAFIDADVEKGRWQAAIPAGLTVGRAYHLIYLYRFTPASGPAEDGEEQTLVIVQTGSDEWTATQETPFPEANGSIAPVFVRWECPDE
ncbi:MAG: hypothetical protein H7067_15375 [Burkholderiales bacterium]|nr:hypothetical protein [Opitutaceae bacterium]